MSRAAALALFMKTKTLLMSRAAALPPFMKTKTFLMSSAAALALLIILISAAAFLSSGDSSVDSELCASEFAQGAYESAFPYCERACSKYDGAGCTRLGRLYDNGDGVKRDTTRAETYYEKACSLNDVEGCNRLGMLYGYLKRDSSTKAKPYFEKACSLNNGVGCRSLGELYIAGRGVKQDYQQAKTYCEKACSLNDGHGCAYLGVLYADGLGVKQNKKVSKEYFGKSCDLGFQDGCDDYRATKTTRQHSNSSKDINSMSFFIFRR